MKSTGHLVRRVGLYNYTVIVTTKLLQLLKEESHLREERQHTREGCFVWGGHELWV